MIQNKRDLKEYLLADKQALGRTSKSPSFHDVIWKYEILLRKCEYYQNTTPPPRGFHPIKKIMGAITRYRRFQLGLKCGFSIPTNTCGKGLCIAHIGPIVISNLAVLGEGCKIHVGVNIGADARSGKAVPRIGNNVYIGPGAKLFGDIQIADSVAIGANAVVNKSFLEEGVSIAGVPAKVINNKGIQGIIKN